MRIRFRRLQVRGFLDQQNRKRIMPFVSRQHSKQGMRLIVRVASRVVVKPDSMSHNKLCVTHKMLIKKRKKLFLLRLAGKIDCPTFGLDQILSEQPRFALDIC